MNKKENNHADKCENNLKEYYIPYRGILGIRFWMVLLFSLICAVVTILSSTTTKGEISSTTFLLFFSIIIIYVVTYLYGFWGVVTAFISTLLFCVTIDTSFKCLIINVFANVIQATILWFVLKKFRFDLKAIPNIFRFDDYIFLMLSIGIVYTVFSLIVNDYFILFFISGGLILVITLFSTFREKNFSKLNYLLFVSFFPSLVGGLTNSINVFLMGGNLHDFAIDGFRWLFCNSILMSTFGYFISCLLCNFRAQSVVWRKKTIKKSIREGMKYKHSNVKVSAIIYYIGMFAWNILFYVMNFIGWLKIQTVFYLFPWIAGNIFMFSNFLLSLKTETEIKDKKERFFWFENRTIVAENSANAIISVVGIFFPLFANYVGGVTSQTAILFTLNLTSAVITLGLIWIPENDIKYIEVIKNIKTVFSLFTLSLLLLSALTFVVSFI